MKNQLYQRSIAFHIFITRSLKKFDLTRECVDFLYNSYPCPRQPSNQPSQKLKKIIVLSINCVNLL